MTSFISFFCFVLFFRRKRRRRRRARQDGDRLRPLRPVQELDQGRHRQLLPRNRNSAAQTCQRRKRKRKRHPAGSDRRKRIPSKLIENEKSWHSVKFSIIFKDIPPFIVIIVMIFPLGFSIEALLKFTYKHCSSKQRKMFLSASGLLVNARVDSWFLSVKLL